MKRRSLIILLSIVSLIITCYVIWWYNDTHTGSRSGQVIDAITGKPIEGAVVYYSWEFGVFMSHAIGGGGAYITREVLTDSKGQYYVPGVYQPKRFIFIDGCFIEERLLVYKDGYAVYTIYYPEDIKGIVGRSFGYGEVQQYSPRNNVVKLYSFKEGVSHKEHVDWISGYSGTFGETELLKKELKKEREMARKEP